jgi:hypothetical protein
VIKYKKEAKKVSAAGSKIKGSVKNQKKMADKIKKNDKKVAASKKTNQNDKKKSAPK